MFLSFVSFHFYNYSENDCLHQIGNKLSAAFLNRSLICLKNNTLANSFKLREENYNTKLTGREKERIIKYPQMTITFPDITVVCLPLLNRYVSMFITCGSHARSFNLMLTLGTRRTSWFLRAGFLDFINEYLTLFPVITIGLDFFLIIDEVLTLLPVIAVGFDFFYFIGDISTFFPVITLGLDLFLFIDKNLFLFPVISVGLVVLSLTRLRIVILSMLNLCPVVVKIVRINIPLLALPPKEGKSDV